MSEATKPLQTPFNEGFTKLAKSAMDRFRVPGISVAVIRDETVFSEGFGHAVLPDKPVTAETLFYCGSTTKSFTTAALALLMEENKDVNWTTPINSIIRDEFVLKNEYMTNHITLEDAACHRTSIPRHDECYGGEDKSMSDVVRRLRHVTLMEAPLRTKWEYSNIPWIAQSLVIEKLSGLSTEEFFRQRIWEPLGMTSTFFGLGQMEGEAKKQDIARGYFWDEKENEYIQEPYMDMSIITGAGANVSNVLDYAKYLKMYMAKSKPLSEAAHKELRKPRACTGNTEIPAVFAGPETYALGWFVQVYRGVEVIQHAGGLIGFAAFMAYIPSLSFGVVLFANTSNAGFFALEAMAYSLVDDALQVPAPERFDFIAHSTKQVAKMKEESQKTRSKLYGEIEPDVAKGLPLNFYEGTYTSQAYSTLTFKIAKQCAVIPQADPEKEILRAEDSLKKLWPHAIELEHVNGPYFIAWTVTPKDGSKVWELRRGVKAEFKILPEGKVKSLGIAMEPAAGDQMIWFERQA